jgi:hypothetical protein
MRDIGFCLLIETKQRNEHYSVIGINVWNFGAYRYQRIRIPPHSLAKWQSFEIGWSQQIVFPNMNILH